MKGYTVRATGLIAISTAILLMGASGFVAAEAHKPRARDLGIPFDGTPGKWNSITDVPGVEVGYTTIVQGERSHAARTGVTVIFPRGKSDFEPVFAAWAPLNGVGEMTGVAFVQEEGILEGPIATTNSLSVGTVRDAVSKWMVRTWTWTEICCLPVVAETHDGYLNDIASFFVREGDVFHAIQSASAGPLLEGNVGGGTGMSAYGFKGGVGTSSRVVAGSWGRYRVGVIVQANFGRRDQLRIAGVEVGRELASMDHPHTSLDPKLDREQGSIIITIATDAPFLPHQLARLAKRATNGLARTGSINDDLSGDIAIAFSTANRGQIIGVSSASEEKLENATVGKVEMMPGSHIDPFFAAVTEATEEAVINALIAADTMTGYKGHRVEAIDHDKVQALLRFHHMLVENSAQTAMPDTNPSLRP
jgi:L-aminopeptidase/D-esterase-like protein